MLLLAIAACERAPSTAPNAIVGSWDELCQTRSDSRTTTNPPQPPLRGTWHLDGDELTVTFGVAPITCSVEHTRGHLMLDELEAAHALRQGLAITR